MRRGCSSSTPTRTGAFHEAVSRLIEKAADAGEATKTDYAYLYDRVGSARRATLRHTVRRDGKRRRSKTRRMSTSGARRSASHDGRVRRADALRVSARTST